MGLKMYLFKRVGRIYHEKTGIVEKQDYEIGYWNRFHDLHDYILHMKNTTDYEEIDLTQEDIEDILDNLNKLKAILETAAPISDTTANKLYRIAIDDAIVIFNDALQLVQQGEEVYYHAQE